MATSRICSIPDCGKKVKTAYLCAMHLWRLKKYGSTAAPPLKSRPKCVVSDCARMSGLAHDANGLCAYHLRRLRRSGTTGVVIADDGAPQRFIAEALQSQTDDCILWPFGKGKPGYGIVRLNGKAAAVHRYICTLVYGKAPTGMYACHSCGVRACINPRHLRFDTPASNNADMDKHGTRRPPKRLTDDQVRQIRSSTEAPKLIAEKFGVSRPWVYNIRQRRCRKTA